MAGNAQYWLGETYYARGKYMEAASAFAEGYKRYPKSAKTPDALLKLGMSLARADQKQNACVALAKLGEEFPQAAASVTSARRLRNEKAGLLTRTAAVAPAPLTLPEFAASLAAIGGFEARPLIAVAVSGGPDSMALMLLADRWARTHGGQAWGLTVDHGLRRESADEARMVGVLARRPRAFRTRSCAGRDQSRPAASRRRRARRVIACSTAWCRDRFCLHLLDGASSRGSDRNASDPPPRRQRRRWAGRHVGGARTGGLPPRATAARRARGAPGRAARGRGAAIPARSEQPEPGLRARPPAAGALG